MNRARFAVAAAVISSMVSAGAALAAQAGTTSSEPLHSVLQGKKITPPIRGEAAVEFTQPVTKAIPGQNKVQTTIKVRNASSAPIARLSVTETWYDKSGAIIAGGKSVINGLLQPGEIQTLVIETPYNKAMSSNNWNFAHANGSVKPAKVKTLEDKNASSASTTAGKAASTTAKKE